MKVPFVDLKAQYASIKNEIDAAIQDVLDNTSFIMGKHVADFEKNFAEFCGAKHCIGVSSGTAALEMALRAIGISSGDEVIVPVNTFIATSEAVTTAGGKVVFVDCDDKTYNIDVTQIEKVITPKTKAIIPVHLYGQPADMDPIIGLAKKHNLTIIEDCAQAHGAEYKGKRVPVAGIGCFSFYPGKNLGAYGDAGAVVTVDDKVMESCVMQRNHGRGSGMKYEHATEGSNLRIDALQAAILNVKLKYLEEWTDARRTHAQLYNKLIADAGLGESFITPAVLDETKPVYHLYVIRTKEREQLQKALKEQEISTGVHYPIPLHLQPAYSYLGLGKGSFPVAEQQADEILSLPMFPELSEKQLQFVVEKIKEFYKQ